MDECKPLVGGGGGDASGAKVADALAAAEEAAKAAVTATEALGDPHHPRVVGLCGLNPS
jgi:putative NIF3 family GTP cyclohydrolase 1 type 2